MSSYTKHISDVEGVFVYTRVSSKRQASDEKYGQSSQLHLCKDYIKNIYPKIKNINYYADVGSSYKNGLILSDMKKMLSELQKKSIILISEASRLGRNIDMVNKILNIVKRKKSYIVSISEELIFGKSIINDIKFMKYIYQGVKESDASSIRVKNYQTFIKQNGGHIGKAPFGYKVVKNFRNIPVLKENPADFELIDKIVDLSSTCCSYEEIKNIMNSKQLFYKKKLWTSKKIKNILNKFYPEHMLLDINNKNQNVVVDGFDDDVIMDNVSMDDESMDDDVMEDIMNDIIMENTRKQNNNLHNKIKNTKYEHLKIVPKNKIYFEKTSSSIKLRSGREIHRF